MKHVYLLIAITMFSLGIIGMYLPVLPTTPFMIASAFFFSKSSKTMSEWFLNSNIYKNNFHSLVTQGTMKKNDKIRTMIIITLLFIVAGYFMRDTMIGLIIILFVWIAHMIGFLFFVKNKADVTEKES